MEAVQSAHRFYGPAPYRYGSTKASP